LITVNPALQLTYPDVKSAVHSTYGCPHISISYWDFPKEIPEVVRTYLQDLHQCFPDADTLDFLFELDSFCLNYFKPVTPQESPEATPLQPTAPPPLPYYPPHNPDTVPLVYH
jgi:hypothetical protein